MPITAKKASVDTDFLLDLEKGLYPTGMFSDLGENLRALARNESAYIPPIRPAQSSPKIQYIAVPTSRDILKNRKNIQNIMQLGCQHGVRMLLFLCSGKARKEDVAILAQAYPELHWMAVDGPFSHEQLHNFKTTHSLLAYDGEKDLAQKRNFAIQFARLLQWDAVFLHDDDLVITERQLVKAADLLAGGSTVVGYSAREFPDNSVVVHANKWTNAPIDSFIGAGAVAVKVNTPVVSFFPHVYNEDWLFLLLYCLLEDSGLTWAGTIKQRRYDPFRDIERARSEEPGDLLAESLMKLAIYIKSQVSVKGNLDDTMAIIRKVADESFWENEINQRILFIQATQQRVRQQKLSSLKKRRVLRSLDYALTALTGKNGVGGIQPQELASWVRAWIDDLYEWNAKLLPQVPCANVFEALAFLKVDNGFMYSGSVGQDTLSKTASTDHLPSNKIADRKRPENPYLSEEAQTGLQSTQILQDYLSEHHLSLHYVVQCASSLRFDRPILPRIPTKPELTIFMLVAEGESISKISRSVQDVRKWNEAERPIEVIVWVYGPRSNHGALNHYRNSITAALVPELSGSNIRLVSSFITSKDKDIDRLIDNGLVNIAFAYWLYYIEGNRPVYVVNTKNELLRMGTFWDFMQQQHTVPTQPLQVYLQPLLRRAASDLMPPFNPEDDRVSEIQAREYLADNKYRRTWSFRRLLRSTPTHELMREIARTTLSWLELDRLTYNLYSPITTHTVFDQPVIKVMCMPVSPKQALKSDLYAIARTVADVLQKEEHPDQAVECVMVIRGNDEDGWEALRDFSDKLTDILRTQLGSQTLLFAAFIDKLPATTSPKQAKARAMTVVRYGHWVQNHEQKVILKWREL